MSAIYRSIAKNSDIVLVVALLGILTILFLPIPPAALDFFIICNFCFALLLLMLTFYTMRPVELSTFPSLLLIATLFRLSLNVSATRLILSEADAGKVIGAIGEYVVGGNYLIGVIVFLILVVVQYVVVTAGAQRVAEVAARFTLDSMPGQQMSIDADLNMGFIDQTEAQRRRKELQKESNFYGAMDGASKFVKGDAIAGIIILLINIIGGFAIGIMQHGMPWAEALQRYTLLTIGDGIVTQVPALIISVGTGIIVTRSAEDARLSNEALSQLMAYPRTLMLVLGALAIMLTLPGLPAWPVLIIATLVGLLWFISTKLNQARTEIEEEQKEEQKPKEATNDLYKDLEVFPIEIQMHEQMQKSAEFSNPPFLDRVKELRTKLAHELGFVMPEVKLRLLPDVNPEAYKILLEGVEIGSGQLKVGQRMVISASGQGVAGFPLTDKDPVFGMPAAWTTPDHASKLGTQGFTVADTATVMLTHITEIVNRHAASLLTRSETDRVLEHARKRSQTLIEELVPAQLTVADIQHVLQNLLREKVSIRHVDAILEVLADKARQTKDIGALTELVRQRLSPAIYQSLIAKSGDLSVLTLDPLTEVTLAESIRKLDGNSPLAIDPRLAEQLVIKLSEFTDKMLRAELKPVILCQPEVRRHLRLFLERVLPQVAVMAINELPMHAQVKTFATINLSQAPAR